MFKFKNLKRLASLFMVLAVCISMLPQAVSATPSEDILNGNSISSLMEILDGSTEEWATGDTEGQINIQLRRESTGAIFTAYKLLDITNESGTLKVSIPGNAQPFWKKYIDKEENVTISEIKAKINSAESGSIVNAFVTFIATADEASKPDKTTSGEAADGKTEITTKFGFYIVQQTGAPANGHIASAPVLACLPFKDTTGTTGTTGTWLKKYTIVPKDDTISVKKQVKASDEDPYNDQTITKIGDTVSYEIKAELPTYGTDILNSVITYTLVDTLPDGVSYKNDSLEVQLKKPGSTAWETLSGLSATESSGTITLDIGEDTYKNSINGKYDAIKITYDAVLNGSAKIAGPGENLFNKNEVTLTYSSYGTETAQAKSAAKVYTLGLTITKVDNDNNSITLAGAHFEVYTTAADGTAIQFVDITGTEPDAIKHYRVATSEDETKTTDIMVTETGENKGKLMIDGLNDTTYYFKETVVPNGYKDPGENRFAITLSNQTATRQSELITNTTGIDLPVTGGIGTIIFTAIGVLLMAGAGYFLFGNKKRSK